MARAVGLHISKDFVRAAEVEGSAKRLRVRSFVDLPVVPQEGASVEDAIAATLERLFKEHRVPRSPVAMGLDTGDAMIRDITVPFTRDDHLKKTLKFELETHVHSHNPDEVVLDYHLLDRTEKDSRVLISALPKALVASRLKQLDKLRVDPVVVDIDADGLLNALAVSGALAEHPNQALVHLDGARVKILVIEGGKLRMARAVHLEPEEDDARPARIAQELTRTLFQAAPEQPIEVVSLSGDGADDEALRVALSERAGVPCETLDVLARCASDVPSEAGSGAKAAVPVGLAFRALAPDSVGLDFRKDEFRYEKRFDAVKSALLATEVFVFVLLCVLYIGCLSRTHWVNQFTLQEYLYNLAEVHDRLNLNPQVTKRPGRDAYEPIDFSEAQPVFNRVKKKLSELEAGRGGNSPVTRSATRYWAEVYGLFGASLAEQRQQSGNPADPWLKVTMLSFGVAPPTRTSETSEVVTLKLSGEVSAVPVISLLVKKLNESGRYAGVTIPTMTGNKFTDWTITPSAGNH